MYDRPGIALRRIVKLVGIVSLTVSAGAAEGGVANLRDALKPLAQNILGVVKKVQRQRQVVIAVGDFTAPPGLDANAGPGISEALKSALEDLAPGIVQKWANLSLRGRYGLASDPKNKDLIIIKVTAEITDSNGNRVYEKVAEIRDTDLIANLMGSTVSLPPAATRDNRNRELQRALQTPQENRKSKDPPGTNIKTKPESPFSIEILVTSKYLAPKAAKDWDKVAARAPRNEEGRAFVYIERDEVYAIRVHNAFESEGAKCEAAVAVSIDGIDTFAFSAIRDPTTNVPKYSHFIVPFGQSTIPGWHKTNDRSDPFLVTEYGKAPASREPEKCRGALGIITVRFALAWTGKKIPEAEKASGDGSNETAFGLLTQGEPKGVVRQVGTLREVISVRYTR